MQQPINILALASYTFLPARMGGQKCIAFLYAFLSKQVNLTCVGTKSNDSSLADYDLLPVLSDSPLRYINVLYFFTLRRIIKQKKITHLQIEHPYYGWLALLLKWFCKVKLIVHSHNIEGLRFKSTGKWWWFILLNYEKIVHQNADYNYFITDEDKEYAIKHFRLAPSKCCTITYGIEWKQSPTAIEKLTARNTIQQKHGIDTKTCILFFNGVFSYKPNLDGLKMIIQDINPLLLKQPEFKYKIIICGKGLPVTMNALEEYANQNIIYTGFVEDIDTYFKAADILLNTTTSGGGIKTKLVEALGYNTTVISTPNGAIGVNASICNGKLIIVEDNNPSVFVTAIISNGNTPINTPDSFYETYYWGNIVEKAIKFISSY
jgi:hypothetical protein